MRDSAARVEVALGDARLSLATEAPQRFDILVIDAFTGDAIPVHLLTVEALDLYLHHLQPHGIIAFHVSNLYWTWCRWLSASPKPASSPHRWWRPTRKMTSIPPAPGCWSVLTPRL